jgi:GTP-binding protein LepA
MREQLLDTMDLERERGITIKLNAVRMSYTARDGQVYELNLIDTPGHVDFTYEVSRSLAACEGAILVVDASQGVQAQTLSNLFLALDAGLEIIPVLNKIDLPGAEPERRAREIIELIGSRPEEILSVSAKEGTGVPDLLEAIIARVPPPAGQEEAPLRALIFDSYFDRYRGAIPSIRVVDGSVRKGMDIAFGAHPDDVYTVDEVGYLQLGQRPTDVLEAGEVGYLVASLRSVGDTRVGDTILDAHDRATQLLPGYREVRSMVFAGLYPTDSDQYEGLRDALEKLKLNDASLHYEPESSTALGFGFRCGFLGLLHMEIVQERLEREFNLDLISTVPTVEYHVYQTDGTMQLLESPTLLPDPANIDRIEEPFVKARIMAPVDYIGGIMKLGQDRRGVYLGMKYLDATRVEFDWEFPLGEIVLDFYDKLKGLSRGYASLDYEMTGYRAGELVRLDMLINGDPIDAFSVIIHKEKAYEWGRKVAEKLKELIPRQLFAVAIQAAIGGKVIARESISALRKDVLAKCYGGDITRKRKLLEKQKEGKKRMKQLGQVEIPQEAFLAVLQVD